MNFSTKRKNVQKQKTSSFSPRDSLEPKILQRSILWSSTTRPGQIWLLSLLPSKRRRPREVLSVATWRHPASRQHPATTSKPTHIENERMSPEKGPFERERVVFQAPFFMGHVGFRRSIEKKITDHNLTLNSLNSHLCDGKTDLDFLAINSASHLPFTYLPPPKKNIKTTELLLMVQKSKKSTPFGCF